MNKKLLIACCGIIAAGTLTAGVACASGNGYKFSYEHKVPVEETVFPLDAVAAVDGEKDAFYGDEHVDFTEVSSGITVKSWAHIAENGLYLYSEADDANVYHSYERNFWENDMIEYYIDPRPDYTASLAALNSKALRTDCINLRVNALGDIQTWVGRSNMGYPWAEGYFKALAAAKIDGEVNVTGGAKGYATEAFIPWSELGLVTKPDAIGVMPAFNNVNNREDTSRTWFTVKGMSHSNPASYARVEENGFVNDGFDVAPQKKLTAVKEDDYYVGNTLTLTEVEEGESSGETRAELKARLGTDGIYFHAVVKDKVCTSARDGIWDNDGIEILIDSLVADNDNVFRSGIFRLGADVDNGLSTSIGLNGFGDFIPRRLPAFTQCNIMPYTEESEFGYAYLYVYEVMVPYTSLGLAAAPASVSFSWAVKSVNETAYLLGRHNGLGAPEGGDWLWMDGCYPRNPSEYILLTAEGIGERAHERYQFPAWTDWENCAIRSSAQSRYDYRGRAATDGLYINMVQYVDNVTIGGVDGDWTKSTHIEAEVWQHNIGYGMGGTYFAFFLDGSVYCNNETRIQKIVYKHTITDRGEGYADGYRYAISYEVYIAFDNNLDNPQDGPYAFVQLMSYTPGENGDGYTCSTIVKDAGQASQRTLYTDDCKSLEFRASGIIAKRQD